MSTPPTNLLLSDMQTTAAGNHPAPNSTPDTRTDELVRKHMVLATESRPPAICPLGKSFPETVQGSEILSAIWKFGA